MYVCVHACVRACVRACVCVCVCVRARACVYGDGCILFDWHMAVIPFLKISLAVFLHCINTEFEFEQHALLALQIVQVVLEELSGLVVWTVSMDISYCLCYIYLFNIIYGFTVCVDVNLSI